MVNLPRRPEQNEKVRDERRRQILKAAIPLFARSGFAETSIGAVARSAGVSHGSVFLYFSSKEELFRAALVEPLAETEVLFLASLEGEGTPLERIRRMVRKQILSVKNAEDYVRLTQHVLGLRERYPELAQALFGFSNRLVGALAPVIRAGQESGEIGPGEPEVIAWSYFSYLNGLPLIVFGAADWVWEQLIEQATRLFGPRFS